MPAKTGERTTPGLPRAPVSMPSETACAVRPSPAAAARQRADEEMSGATALLISTVLQMYEQLSSQALELMQEKHARERAEAALRHSESRWKFLLEGSSEGLWE